LGHVTVLHREPPLSSHILMMSARPFGSDSRSRACRAISSFSTSPVITSTVSSPRPKRRSCSDLCPGMISPRSINEFKRIESPVSPRRKWQPRNPIRHPASVIKGRGRDHGFKERLDFACTQGAAVDPKLVVGRTARLPRMFVTADVEDVLVVRDLGRL